MSHVTIKQAKEGLESIGMWMDMRCLAFILASCLFVGCNTSRPVFNVGIAATPEVTKAVETSASFLQARSINPLRTIWFVEGQNGVYTHIYVGFDGGWHTIRSATLRVGEDRIIEREELRDDGEFIWIPDK